MTNIFEQPWLLLIVSGVVLLAVIAVRGLAPGRCKWWFWLLPIIIAGGAFAVDFLVRTDNEKLRSVIYRAVNAIEKENIRAMEPLIAKDYSDSLHRSKQSLLHHFEPFFEEPVIQENVLRIISLDIRPPAAEAVFTVRVVFDPRGPVYEYLKMMIFKLRADLREDGDEWQFTRIEVIEPADWKSMQSSFREAID
jgi:hypothetical protein